MRHTVAFALSASPASASSTSRPIRDEGMPQRQALVQKAHQVRPCSDATRNDIGAKPTLA